MGSDVTLPSFTNQKTYTEIFDEVFPYYMAIGMSYDEFWNDLPIKAKYYREADKIKQERMNEQLWLNGIYTLKALETTLGNMFGKKGTKLEYPNEPLPITEQAIERQREEQQLREQEELKIKFMNIAHGINKNLKKGG